MHIEKPIENIFTDESKNHKILVVEDSEFFNKAVTKSLLADGCDVVQAFTMKEAIEHLESNKFDYILLDLILPDGEGDEIIDMLPKTIRSKVIVLSGDNDVERREHIFKSGVLDYFSKSNPFHLIMDDIKSLIKTIEQNSYINIMIVDDSSFLRKMLKAALAPRKFNIYEAKSAKEGLDLLKTNEINLILLDYEMPEMNGLEMLEKIKKNSKFLELPVIMLSGNSEKENVARALKHGASDYITKPFANEELILKCDLHVKAYLNLKQLQYKEKELQESIKKVTEAEKHKSTFLANMSHEIRTPLNGILGFVDLLEAEESDPKKIDHLKTIQASGDLLLNIINDILDFSKIENDKIDLNIDIFEVADLFQLITSLYLPMMSRKHIKFKSDTHEDTPKYFKSDFLRIKQIIANLLGNAIKFTPEHGEITFDIKTTEDNKFLEFSVRDNGIGIDPSNHKKVFEIFSQAESTTTKKFGGTGLGLSISAKLVKLLGGEIGLESELNKGSRFYFTLPIVEFKESELPNLSKKRNADKKEFNFNKKALLVEDNKTNQKFMFIILKKLGFTYDIADDGIEAVNAFTNSKYDVIFMDENMPNMNGIEATKKIIEIEKEQNLKHTPIIALTANALKGDRERFIEAGMDEYLTKPVNKQKLAEILQKLLGKIE